MDMIGTLMMIVPVILIAAFILLIVRRISEKESLIDMRGAVVGVIILVTAVLVIAPMAMSTVTYLYDDETGTLTVQKDITGSRQPWTDIDPATVKSIVIKEGVTTIASGAFSGMANVEHVSIAESVTTIGAGAFGVGFQDPYGESMAPLAGYEYAGLGEGTVWQCDPAAWTYNAQNAVTGLASGYEGVIYAVIPDSYLGSPTTRLGVNLLSGNATVKAVLCGPGNEISTSGTGLFRNCSALEALRLPETLTELPVSLCNGCSGLASVQASSKLTVIGHSAFKGCSGLTEIDFPASLTAIDQAAFYDSGLTEIDFPASLTAIGIEAFRGCTAIARVDFAAGFSPTLASTWATSWTFYGADGTTVIDKTVAANLAGKTFQGTASALIEVEPGQLELTPQQIQLVHDLTALHPVSEIQLTDPDFNLQGGETFGS